MAIPADRPATVGIVLNLICLSLIGCAPSVYWELERLAVAVRGRISSMEGCMLQESVLGVSLKEYVLSLLNLTSNLLSVKSC